MQGILGWATLTKQLVERELASATETFFYKRNPIQVNSCTALPLIFAQNNGWYAAAMSLNNRSVANANTPEQWFSTCGPWPTGWPQKYFAVGHRAVWFEKVVLARLAVYSLALSESLQKVAVNGELTCFLLFFFCLEFTRFRPEEPFEFC